MTGNVSAAQQKRIALLQSKGLSSADISEKTNIPRTIVAAYMAANTRAGRRAPTTQTTKRSKKSNTRVFTSSKSVVSKREIRTALKTLSRALGV